MVKITLILLILNLFVSMASEAQLPAFPGAEGGGRFTTGGRGGKVIYVTSLNDDANPGSLRYGIAQTGPRIILFKVSGTIKLKSTLNIKNANITIAGQTAPGDGICLRDYAVVVDADNVIIRYLRFRMGDEALQENDCIWGRNRKNIMIDHCSMSWSTDECASFYDNENFTMQWCLLSESLKNSVHDKGAHGYGGIWGGSNASFHHNLLADHDSRNPRFCGSRYSNQPDREIVDFRNNVIYNWGANNAYGAEGGSYNLISNYFKAGPATSSSSKSRILQPYADDGSNSQPAGTYGKFYLNGNYLSVNPAVSADNWLGVILHSSFTSYAPGIIKNDLKSDVEYPFPETTTHSAGTAFLKVLDYAGASLMRDTVDKRIVRDVRNGIATYMTGGNGSVNGIIDTQSAVGGWPELLSLPAPADSDDDGMPDNWEDAHGLNKTLAGDAQLNTVDGKYPNLEVYINSLVSDITDNQVKEAILASALTIPEKKDSVRLHIDRNGHLKIDPGRMIRRAEIFSVSGALLNVQESNLTQVDMDISFLKPGIYVVRVFDSEKQVHSVKFMKP